MSLLTPEEFVTKMKNDLMNDDFDGPTCAAVRGNALFLAILHPSMEFKKGALRAGAGPFGQVSCRVDGRAYRS